MLWGSYSMPVPAQGSAVSGSSVAHRTARLCATSSRPTARPQDVRIDSLPASGRCAAALLLSTGLLYTSQASTAFAADIGQEHHVQPLSAYVATLVAPRAVAVLTSAPPLASTAAVAAGASAAGSLSVAGVVEEAEELALELVDFFHHGMDAVQHGVEAMETTIHHLQVTHALERLENVPLNQVVDLELLKAAMHPADAAPTEAGELQEGAPAPVPAAAAAPGPASSVAHRQLDAALDGVAEWRLRDVVDVHKLARALQDVPLVEPLDERRLVREALRIRRHVHWETVADAVRPQPLRKALAAMGGRSGNPFAELDMRAAVGAVRLDTVRAVLAPPRPAAPERSHSLESSGMWTWDSM